MAKRIISAMLCLFMLMSMLACSDTPAVKDDNTPSGETTAAAEETTEADPYANNLPDKNLDGFEFRILAYSNNIPSIYSDEINGGVVNDAVVSKIVSVEERFNCDIVLSSLSDPAQDTGATTIETEILANENNFDIVQGHDITMGNLSLQGYFIDVMTMPYLELDKPWWSQSTNDSLTVNGKMYLMSNNISYFQMGETRVLYFNKSMMTDLGLDFPYNKVYDGTWTLDAMAEMINNTYVDKNGNSKVDKEDTFGMVNANWYCWLEPYCVEPYVEQDDGELVYSFPLEKITTLVEKFNALLFTGNGFLAPDGETGSHLIFSSGQSLFYYETLKTAVNVFSSSDIVFGILPMPKIDETQDKYYGGCTDRPIAVPITAAANLDNIALITEALNIEGYRQVFPAYYEMALKARYADASDDAAMIDLIHNNVILAFTYLYGNYSSPYSSLMGACFSNMKTQNLDVASWAAKQEKAQSKWVEKVNSFFQGETD